MRVLLTTVADSTHFMATVPLAWALRTAGHEVRVASQPPMTATITQAGLTAQPVGRALDLGRLETEVDRDAVRKDLPPPYHAAELSESELDWPTLLAEYREATLWWHKLDNVPMINDLVSFARQWQPDLVLWEPTTFAGAIAARACGAAHGRVLYTLDVFGKTRQHFLRLQQSRPAHEREDPIADFLGGYVGGDFAEDLVTGQFTIEQLPPPLRMSADLDYVPMRYVQYGGPAVVPDWVRTPPSRPRVVLTLGISATEHFDGYTIDIPEVLDALSDLDIELVATIAEEEQGKLGPVPDNTRVVSYVPLPSIVPSCAAVIHHAGFGTLSTVSRFGVPQLAVPFHFDQPSFARRLAAQGSTLMLHSDQASGDAVRTGLLRVLEEPEFRTRAGALRSDVLAMPTPNEVVTQLEQLVTKHRDTNS
ncbi:activator-dependent family glycosyltransferase [Prauserella cavernicola]|uniref:Activator-dependent family glycosyltransferase n=1 Tax=Prauserella cavernicola TaxID=2800127 RepID=A0A934QWS2_9PSEU|nr:activator-dependent family glycosyltransferase [Prauserella cavernicola]MBK1787861.1 activator-dependent family glycosyltransferase [Prauserella cavernicola]